MKFKSLPALPFKAIMFLAVLYFTACTKDQNFSEKISSKASKATTNYRAISNLKTEAARGLSFSNYLNPKEKSDFIIIRLESAVKDLHLEGKRLDFINKVIQQVNPDLYVKGSPANLNMIANEPVWRKEAKEFFNLEEFRYIFASHMIFEEYQTKILNSKILSAASAGSEIPDCECSANIGDYCTNPTVCKQRAEENPCTERNFYCGWLFLMTCDGLCK